MQLERSASRLQSPIVPRKVRLRDGCVQAVVREWVGQCRLAAIPRTQSRGSVTDSQVTSSIAHFVATYRCRLSKLMEGMGYG